MLYNRCGSPVHAVHAVHTKPSLPTLAQPNAAPVAWFAVGLEGLDVLEAWDLLDVGFEVLVDDALW